MPVKNKFLAYQVPVVRILEQEELPLEQLTAILQEIDDRHFNAILQVLIEAKFKAEAMLRDDSIMVSHGRVTFFQGWVAYSDYGISNLIRLREQPMPERIEAAPGPE